MLETLSEKKTKPKKALKRASSAIPVDLVERYARSVVSGEELAGPLVRQACRRHLRDLEEGPKRGLKWDWAAAEHVIDFFSNVLCLAGGEHEGKPFLLHPSQQFIVGSIFGWKGPDGYRRFRVAYIEEAKGNGKSPLAAGIGLYMLTADNESRAEVYAAATDKDQARVLFRDAVAMVDQSIGLDKRLTRSGGAGREWNLAYLDTGSFFRPISSESTGRGKSGPRPHCVLLDEIHEHPTNAMVEFLRAGTKGRRQALVLMTTNSGVCDPTSVCWNYHNYAESILNQTIESDSFFGYVCGLDPGDSWTDPSVRKKSNPLLGFSITEKYLDEQVRDAEGMPSKQSIVRRLNFCEWVQAANPFVDPEVWRSCGQPVDVPALKGRRCVGALDLSGKNDLTSLALEFDPDENGVKDVLSFNWTPAATLREREKRDRAPYAQWIREGYLLSTPGSSIDYSFVAQKIVELCALYDIDCIAFDKYRIEDLQREIDDIGGNVTLKPWGQGFIEMNPAIEALEDDILEGRLRHGNNPLLTWAINNIKILPDAVGNRRFDKRHAVNRIDPAVALAMASGLMASTPDSFGDYSSTLI